MIIKPTRIIENKDRIIEVADLLIDLRKEMYKKYGIEDQFFYEDHINWAIDQSVMRLGLKDEVDYGTLNV